MWVGQEIGCWAGRRGMVSEVVCGSCARGIVGGKCDGESAETPVNILIAGVSSAETEWLMRHSLVCLDSQAAADVLDSDVCQFRSNSKHVLARHLSIRRSLQGARELNV